MIKKLREIICPSLEEDPNGMKSMFVIFLGVLLSYITYKTTATQVFQPASDFAIHAEYVAAGTFGAYPIWHMITFMVMKLLKANQYYAAAITQSFVNGIIYCIVYLIFLNKIKFLKRTQAAIMSFILLVVGPLTAPWFNENYYLGQWSPNTWHNPTNIMAKPFAIICFFMVVSIVHRYLTKEKNTMITYILLAVILCLSALSKPSFLQGFIPGLGLYLVLFLLITKGKSFFLSVKLILAFVPSVVILFWQYIAELTETGSGARIAWLELLHYFTPNVLISFLLAFAFPIFVFIMNPISNIKKVEVQMVFCYEIAAWLESALLIQTGDRALHANFCWASMLSMFMVWFVMLIQFIKYLSEEDKSSIRYKVTKFVGFILLWFHFLFGLSVCI